MTFFNDLRYALRQFRRAPGFSVLAIVTLALGIGATTTIFSLVDQVLLRDLPVRDPKQLVMLQYEGSNTGHTSTHGGNDKQYFSYPMYRELRDRNSVFSGMIAMLPTQVGLQWHDTPGLANAEVVSGNYFDVLGVRPALGRLFVQSDEGPKGSSPIAVLSFTYWQNRFGSDPSIVNQTVLINGQPFTVIGISAPKFHSAIAGTAPDVFALMDMKPQITPGWDDLDDARSVWLNVAARLKDGITVQQAEAGITPLWKALRAEELKAITTKNEDFRMHFVEKSQLTLVEGSQGFAGFQDGLRTPLYILAGMVGLLSLMASANVAGLLLVRAAGRVREMSVRYALGATRRRVTQQLIAEGILLGLIGCLFGVGLAPLLSATLLRVIFTNSGTMPLNSSPDIRILGFSIVLSLVLSMLFSITPVLQFWRPNVTPALKQQTVTATGGHVAFRRLTVGVQIGLSVILLVGAGLFIRTLRNLQTVDVGFSTDHLLTFQVDPRMSGYQAEQVGPLYQRMLDTLAAQPGVKSVALTDNPDLANNDETFNLDVPGIKYEDRRRRNSEWERVSPGYLATLQQPLIAGRFISDADQMGSLHVTVVNEMLAKNYFGAAQAAIGRSFKVGRDEQLLTIVGVIGDAKHRGVREETEQNFYTSIFQEKRPSSVEFYVRTYQQPETAVSTIRATMHDIDSKIVLDQMRSMGEQISGILSTERLLAMLASGFGVLAVVMAAVGLYGVLAFSTAQRTREIGVRMALGATRLNVVKMVMREVLWLGGVSIAVAIPIALVLSQVLRNQLFGISARDPLTIFAVTVTIGLVACAAAFIPARRASTVDPMTALRYE
jgi:predicted permease